MKVIANHMHHLKIEDKGIFLCQLWNKSGLSALCTIYVTFAILNTELWFKTHKFFHHTAWKNRQMCLIKTRNFPYPSFIEIS